MNKDSENNEDDNNNINNNTDYLVKKINDIINKELILPKLNFDEYDIFNELYKKLIGINETKIIINEILGELDEKSKKDFENILLTKRINIIKENNKDMVDDQKKKLFIEEL